MMRIWLLCWLPPRLKHKKYQSNWLMLKSRRRKSTKRENNIDQWLLEVQLCTSPYWKWPWLTGCITLHWSNSWCYSINQSIGVRRSPFQPKEWTTSSSIWPSTSTDTLTEDYSKETKSPSFWWCASRCSRRLRRLTPMMSQFFWNQELHLISVPRELNPSNICRIKLGSISWPCLSIILVEIHWHSSESYLTQSLEVKDNGSNGSREMILRISPFLTSLSVSQLKRISVHSYHYVWFVHWERIVPWWLQLNSSMPSSEKSSLLPSHTPSIPFGRNPLSWTQCYSYCQLVLILHQPSMTSPRRRRSSPVRKYPWEKVKRKWPEESSRSVSNKEDGSFSRTAIWV